MSRRKAPRHRADRPIPLPVDVVDGIPDRSARRAWPAYLILAVIFAGWIGFLAWVAFSGGD